MKEINNSLTNSLRLGPLEVGPGGPAHRPRIRIPLKKENEMLQKCENDFSEEAFRCPNGKRIRGGGPGPGQKSGGPQRRQSAVPGGNTNNCRKMSPKPRDGIERQS